MRTIIKQRGATFGEGSRGGVRRERAVIDVDNQDVYATISLVAVQGTGDNNWFASASIEKITSNGVTEDFKKSVVTEIFRKNVTQVTFIINVADTLSSARWQLNYWSKD